MLPNTIGLGQVTSSAGQFYTVALNLGVLFAIASAGFAMVLLVLGYIEENPTKINEAKTSIISCYIAITAIALFQTGLGAFFTLFHISTGG